MKGKFITLEGSEGCGKTTQIKLLSAWLEKQDIEVICLREPGGTDLGEAIRHILKHDPAGRGMSSEAELLLFEASRAELVRKIILPYLQKGSWILCDRFYDSTIVYQGHARGLDLKSIEAINHFAISNCKPDLTLVLELDSAEANKRISRRAKPVGQEDRFESEPDAFFEKVREGYRQIAKQEPDRVKLVSALGDQQEVFQRIQKEIQHVFHSLLD